VGEEPFDGRDRCIGGSIIREGSTPPRLDPAVVAEVEGRSTSQLDEDADPEPKPDDA
jgi:hypothetical protein